MSSKPCSRCQLIATRVGLKMFITVQPQYEPNILWLINHKIEDVIIFYT